MKVRDLIEQLGETDPDLEVRLAVELPSEWEPAPGDTVEEGWVYAEIVGVETSSFMGEVRIDGEELRLGGERAAA